ncbi:MAG: ABC transporter ATP-binding protein [Patescibacteria group bacterium]|nr:ABC transporter ATP-binding protein [Patescibacteria group bacterium]
MPALEVKNLLKKYGNFTAVNGISFAVAEKEIFALIGPNGAGKSTTLKIISTILSPTSGTALVYGMDVVKESAAVRRQISYLPEEAGAYKNLTGLEYLEFMASLYAENPAQQKEFVSFAGEIAGLKDKLGNKVKTYSKGMTRKLLLARTVMTKPRLAILDEPTSGLDIINALEIRKTIRSLANSGMAVLLSSHNMLEIEFLSDRVGIIYNGSILETGTAAQLKQTYQARNLEEVFMAAVARR